MQATILLPYLRYVCLHFFSAYLTMKLASSYLFFTMEMKRRLFLSFDKNFLCAIVAEIQVATSWKLAECKGEILIRNFYNSVFLVLFIYIIYY